MYTYLKLAFSAILLLCLSAVYSQDRLVTSEGETIKGKINGVGRSMLKLKTEDGKTLKFGPQQVAKVRDNGDDYLSRQVLDKKRVVWRFLRVIDGGAVNLMTIDERSSPGFGVSTGMGSMGMGGIGVSVGGGRSKPAYYIEKNGETTVLEDILPGFMAGASRKQAVTERLHEVMGDLPEVADRINNTKRITANSLLDLVKYYNDLSGTKLFYNKESK